MRELLRLQLERDGHTVLTVEDGLQLCDQLEQFIPDLLIVDLLMPNLSGLEVCRRVRERQSFFRNVPILMISSLEEKEHAQMAHWAGADDYLQKPFNRLDLALRVSSLLLIHNLEDHLRHIGAEVNGDSLRRLRTAWMEVVRGKQQPPPPP